MAFIIQIVKTKAQNYQNGTEPDGRAGIIHITQDEMGQTMTEYLEMRTRTNIMPMESANVSNRL